MIGKFGKYARRDGGGRGLGIEGETLRLLMKIPTFATKSLIFLDLKTTSYMWAVFTRLSLWTPMRMSFGGCLSEFDTSFMTEAGVDSEVSQKRSVFLMFVRRTSSAKCC